MTSCHFLTADLSGPPVGIKVTEKVDDWAESGIRLSGAEKKEEAELRGEK